MMSSSITGTYMPTSYKSDIEETQVSYGSKSDNNTSETLSESNDFVSCDNSDKSSDSVTKEMHHVIPPLKTKDQRLSHLLLTSRLVKVMMLKTQNSTSGNPSFSVWRIFCPCVTLNGTSVSAGSRNSPASVPAGRSDSAASRNRPAVNSAGRPNPAGWSKRPATVSAGRPVSAGTMDISVKTSQLTPWRNKRHSFGDPRGDPSTDNDIGIVDSGCSRSMTGNKEKLADFVPIKGGIVKFLEVEMGILLAKCVQLVVAFSAGSTSVFLQKREHNSSSVSDSSDLAYAPVSDKKHRLKNPSLVESAFIGYIQDQQSSRSPTDHSVVSLLAFLTQLEPIYKETCPYLWQTCNRDKMDLKNKRDARGMLLGIKRGLLHMTPTREGIDYERIFAQWPMNKMSIRLNIDLLHSYMVAFCSVMVFPQAPASPECKMFTAFCYNTITEEIKYKALGSNGRHEWSREGIVWKEVCGRIMRSRSAVEK
ncbi:hypothetical protein Tco_0572283 [Tanacetum coccineum]